ncbi:MAG: UDP-glucuronate 4-epimerase [Chloroflexota bacterium]|jgi:nucleoside-diphosphate-sugar epimerase|nr:UDP-glucuronate 4-epimerase [Chloroflexota bacterium]
MSVEGERFLVTGALGFIGAWTVRTLVRDGAAVTTFDLGSDDRRLRQIMTPEEFAKVHVETGDITDLGALTDALHRSDASHVIHLAALQVPFCRADPPLGARVNVLGTVNVFEAVKRRAVANSMAPVVYTSSIGMYGLDDADPSTGRLHADATAHPLNHYGVYKLANEGNARVYWLDDGIPSIGLRPMTVYGVGRDQGMTSGPTKAIAAAVLGEPFVVPFRNATMYQYGEDVAHALIAASRSSLPGAHVFNLPGIVADGPTFLEAIEEAVPGASDLIRFDAVDLPFPSEIDHDGIEALGSLPVTPLADGVRASADTYRSLAEAGRLKATDHGLEPAAIMRPS